MWAVFIFALGLLGIFLINTFGVITTTNQQDYTLLKNSVEAAMNDAIDWYSYRAGFYLCIDNGSIDKSVKPIKFSSKNDYHIVLNTPYNRSNHVQSVQGCDFLEGEVKINQDVFVESFVRRYANNINNNKSYQVTIQEVIEYPPKVSVRIDALNTYNSVESRTKEFNYNYDYNIRNQIDSILEEKS